MQVSLHFAEAVRSSLLRRQRAISDARAIQPVPARVGWQIVGRAWEKAWRALPPFGGFCSPYLPYGGQHSWFRDSFRTEYEKQNAAIGRFNLAISARPVSASPP